MRKICVVTGSRAEYGIMSGLMAAIQQDRDLELQVIATNMHLSPEFGLTYKEILQDGFTIHKKVEMLLSSDSSVGITKSVGLGVIGFADAYADLQPDLLLVLGDRYEVLAAVEAALFFKIPVAHIHGGEISEGAFDDCIRHSITKMSHLHFTSTEKYRSRVIQLGEYPNRVFYTGALGVENIRRIELLSKQVLEESLGFEFTDKCFLVTYHPVTLENSTAEEQIEALLEALNEFVEYKVLFTMPNSDTEGRVIMRLIRQYAERFPQKCKVFTSLGMKRYFSALQYITAVVGNSSSGIIEVPGFGIPTLNIGDRQRGRIAAPSVINCHADKLSIQKGIERVLSRELREVALKGENPYKKENTAELILKVLKEFPLEEIVQKSFYDL